MAEFLFLLLAGAVVGLEPLCEFLGAGGIACHQEVEGIQRAIHAPRRVEPGTDAEGNMACTRTPTQVSHTVQSLDADIAAFCRCIDRLNKLEKANCPNPDEPAGCFGDLMGELLVYEEEMWAPTLRKLGNSLGRYIYLADAAVDYRRDQKKKQYNPFLAMGMEEDPAAWEQYLVLAMGRCTDAYERLPLVQDKDILDNILYSGIWLEYRRKQRKTGGEDG